MSDFEEKVWKYMVDHKTPVSVKGLARRFIVSDSKVLSAFRKLVAGGVVEIVRMGSAKYYKVKE
jgi:Mn-dependent DtxR family transcriptional regulator